MQSTAGPAFPLADRVGGFVVNPKVNPEAKLMLCSLANSDHDHTSAQGTESFLSYAFNYWQYATSFVYWSGSEEGLVCCPTGEFTDAAHTNGVPVVATLGFPWGRGRRLCGAGPAVRPEGSGRLLPCGGQAD